MHLISSAGTVSSNFMGLLSDINMHDIQSHAINCFNFPTKKLGLYTRTPPQSTFLRQAWAFKTVLKTSTQVLNRFAVLGVGILQPIYFSKTPMDWGLV